MAPGLGLVHLSTVSSQPYDDGPVTCQRVAFQLLGPTEARRDGELIPLSGPRRRALVARLLLDAGRVVPADALIEDVWDGKPTAAAPATLQSHVSQLRKVLGDCLQSRTHGYVLALDDVLVDTAEFEREVASGSARLAGGERRSAAAALREALALWRGRALQDVADRPWAQPEAARLEELREFALEQLLRARLEAGEHEHVAADAEAAVTDQPLREQRWAILMLALYRCGRQADALRAYQRLRVRLADELGIDPSPALGTLEAAILRHDPRLDRPVPDPRPGPPSAPPDGGAPLPQARAAAVRRDWRSAYELLVAADGVDLLDAEDLELLGDAAFMAGDQEASIAARQRAHTIWLQAGQRSRAAVAALLIVGNHYVRNRPAIAAGWFHKGRRLLQDEAEGPAHGVLAFTGALIALARGEPDAALEAAAQAQLIGERFGHPDIEAVGLTLQGCALARLGRLDQAQALLDEALACASSGRVGPIATGQIFCWSTQALLAVADFERAAEWIDAIDSCGIGGIPGDCRVHRAEVLRAVGRLEEAQGEALAARMEIQAVDLIHAGIAHYELAMIHLARGELDHAERALRHAATCGASSQPGQALLQLAQGHPAAAAASIRTALTDAALDDLRRARLLPAAVQVALALDDENEASERVAELERIADRFRTDGLIMAAREARSNL